MLTAFDSSALTKRHIEERGSARVLELLAEADKVIASILVIPEIVSALNRRRRTGSLAEADYQVHMRDLREDLGTMRLLELTDTIIDEAIRCLEEAPLRASDAIHVASAIEAGVDRFVSADRRQCRAARALGLTVEEIPLDEPAP